jgi:pimeloyl-ACP methyl ester carboxylesterase
VAAVAAQPDSLVIDRLTEVRVPVIAIVGERDRAFHGGAAYLERKIGARMIIVPSAGHHVHETHPEAVNEAIAELLDAS